MSKPRKTIRCVCDYCGAEFTANRSDARFCSAVHKAAYSNAKKFFDNGGSVINNDVLKEEKIVTETELVPPVKEKIKESKEDYYNKFKLIYGKPPICDECLGEIKGQLGHQDWFICLLKKRDNNYHVLEQKILLACSNKCAEDIIKKGKLDGYNDSFIAGKY